MKKIVAIAISLFLLALVVDANEFRIWTSASGNHKTEAKMVSISKDGKTITLLKKDGKEIEVELEKLSKEDQEHIRKTANFTGIRCEYQEVTKNGPWRQVFWIKEVLPGSPADKAGIKSNSYFRPDGATAKPESIIDGFYYPTTTIALLEFPSSFGSSERKKVNCITKQDWDIAEAKKREQETERQRAWEERKRQEAIAKAERERKEREAAAKAERERKDREATAIAEQERMKWVREQQERIKRNPESIIREGTDAEMLRGAIALGDIETVKYFVSQGADVNANQLLHFAAAGFANADVAKFLVSKGANVHLKNDIGCTPLHFAIANVEVAKFLVSQGADVNAKNDLGFTPLHIAADNDSRLGLETIARVANVPGATARDNYEVVKFLVSKGANVNAKDNDGKTPLDVARETKNTLVIKYLESIR